MSIKDPWRQSPKTDQRSLSGLGGGGSHRATSVMCYSGCGPLETIRGAGRFHILPDLTTVLAPPALPHRALSPGPPSLCSLPSRPATGLTSRPEDTSDDIPAGERGRCTAAWCPHPCPSALLGHVSTTAPQRKICDGFQTDTRDLSSSWMRPQSRQAPKARLL